MPAAKPVADTSPKALQFRCESTDEVEFFRNAADAIGLRPNTWYRMAVLRAADQSAWADELLAHAVERGTVQLGRADDREAITTTSVMIRLPADEYAAVVAAIERSGYTRSQWIRTVLRSAAGDETAHAHNAELAALFTRLAAVKPRRAAGARR